MSDTTDTERTVPYDRFKEVNDSVRELKAALADERRRREEMEDASKPDIERLTKQVEKLTQERDGAVKQYEAAQREAQLSHRRSTVSETAAKLGFRNPADAALFVNLDEIEDAKQAESALKAVAKDRDYLLAPKQPDARGLERVPGSLVDQTPGQPTAPGLLTEDEYKRQVGQDLLAQIDKVRGVQPQNAA